jgi:Zn-dependent protease
MIDIIVALALYFPPLFFAVTFHEAAHCYADKWLAKKPAAYHANVSLNPLQHIHIIGTIITPIITIIMGSLLSGTTIALGWGKPAPVPDYHQLNKYKRIIVALAGPLSHVIGCYVWALTLLLAETYSTFGFLQEIAIIGVWINIFLMLINLIPILPLDGGRVVEACLSGQWLTYYQQFQPYILVSIVVLALCGVLTTPLITIAEEVIRILIP